MLGAMWSSAQKVLAIVAIAWFQLGVVSLGWAQTENPSKESNEEQLRRSQDLSRTIMSPFCPGRTLDSCPSPYAAEWREDIRDMVAEGMSSEEIRAALKKRTNKDLTGAPSTALDSVLPVLVTVVALLLLILLLRVLIKPSKATGNEPARRETKEKPPTDRKALDKRLDEELEELDDT